MAEQIIADLSIEEMEAIIKQKKEAAKAAEAEAKAIAKRDQYRKNNMDRIQFLQARIERDQKELAEKSEKAGL
jgi:hypothetical protein